MSSPSLTESAGSATPTRYWSPRPWKATCPPGCAVQTGTGSWWRAGRLPVDERDGPPARAAATGPAGRGRDEEKRRAGLAREALARAKADARAHGLRPGGPAAKWPGRERTGVRLARGRTGVGRESAGVRPGLEPTRAGTGPLPERPPLRSHLLDRPARNPPAGHPGSAARFRPEQARRAGHRGSAARFRAGRGPE